MARLSIWTRAKHRVGLERPYYLALCRGQSDPWVAPSQQDSSFARVPFRICNRTAQQRGRLSEECKDYRLHLETCHVFTEGSCNTREVKDLLQPGRRNSLYKGIQIGRERPHFFGFQPPQKVFGVTPARFPA